MQYNIYKCMISDVFGKDNQDTKFDKDRVMIKYNLSWMKLNFLFVYVLGVYEWV